MPCARAGAEILELGSAIRQLQREGLDDAAVQLLIARKRARLEHLVTASKRKGPAMAEPSMDARE
ncbi:hypothetical protein [Bradyrhizobium liaoningense]